MALEENEIRPDRLMAEQQRRFENDVRRLLGHSSEFVKVACPACEAARSTPLFEKYGLSFVACVACDTFYISPRPTPEMLSWYYKTSENYWYWNKYIFPASEGPRREKIFRPRAHRLAAACTKFGIRGGTLLEVGAGYGTFAECVRDLRLFERQVLVEPTPDLAATCRGKGFEVLEQTIEETALTGLTAEVVASFEVIEHLFSPRQFLEACSRVTRPGGLLVLSCPNGLGFDIHMLQSLSGSVDVEHLNYFNPRSLSGLVGRCGFDVLEVTTPGELDAELVRKKVLGGELDISADRFLRRVLVDEWERLGGPFQRFLAENRLSGHMMLVARKPA